MGATQEKKRRREERENGTEKRLVQNKQYEERRRKNKIRVLVTCSVLAVFVLVVVFFSIPQLYSGFEAINIDGESFSLADYNYYYYATYYSYYDQAVSTYGSYYSYAMPDNDTLRSETLSSMRTTVKLAHEAEAAGFELTDDMRAEYDEYIEGMRTEATDGGYSSFSRYLKDFYGNIMTEEVFNEQSQFSFFASKYSESVYDSYEFTAEELANYYSENSEEYDILIYRSFEIEAITIEDNEETETDETVDSETAMATAREEAAAFVDSVQSEQDFIDTAYEYADEDEKENYEDDNETLRHYIKSEIGTEVYEWLTAEGREEGDIAVIETDSACEIVYYIGYENNQYPLANARMLFIDIDTVLRTDYDSDEEYQAARETEIEEAMNEAEGLLEEFEAGNATSEDFAALSDEYDETSDRNDGGLVENIYKYRYESVIDDWLFEEERTSGDVELFYIEGDGYYIIYFESYGENYCDYIADMELRSEEHTAWLEELETTVESSETFWYNFAA